MTIPARLTPIAAGGLGCGERERDGHRTARDGADPQARLSARCNSEVIRDGCSRQQEYGENSCESSDHNVWQKKSG